jgi:hypothetical protein
MCQSLIGLLSGSASARRAARAHPTLLPRLQKLAEVRESEVLQHLRFLIMVVRVLDDEELVVLHPQQQRGYRVRISGIFNLYQLRTLLAGALVGDPAEGWLEGTLPDPRAIAAARDRPVDPDADHVPICFDLLDWKGLRPDGTPDPNRVPEYSDLPADLPLFGPSHVLLLGALALEHEGYAGRPIERMTADLRVEAMLSETETCDWLERLRKAPR